MHTVDKVKDIVASVETACDEQGDSMPRVMGMIFVLSKYFDEDVNELVRQKQVMIKLWNKKCHNLIQCCQFKCHVTMVKYVLLSLEMVTHASQSTSV